MNKIDSFLLDLSNRLKETLPAFEAHKRVMQHRQSVVDIGEKAKLARKSAVLALLYPKENKLHTVFILRSIYKGVHSGQISFPGGSMEPTDSNLMETALREANEELSIVSEKVQILGNLSPIFVPPSNFIIEPYLGFQSEQPHFIADPYEVQGILECPLDALIAPNSLINSKISRADGHSLNVKGFQLNNHLIWGATAMVVEELVEVLSSLKVPNDLRP